MSGPNHSPSSPALSEEHSAERRCKVCQGACKAEVFPGLPCSQQPARSGRKPCLLLVDQTVERSTVESHHSAPPLRRRPCVVVVKPNCHTASTSDSAMPPPWSDSLQAGRWGGGGGQVDVLSRWQSGCGCCPQHLIVTTA